MSALAKICGLTTPEALDAAVAGGAAYAGMVFFPPSPRHLDPERARELRARVPSHLRIVAVFVDPDDALLATACQAARPEVVQLHGDEPPHRAAEIARRFGVEVWKAVPVRAAADIAAAAAYRSAAARVLFDARPPAGAELPGGNGLRFDWRLLAGVRPPAPWGLSGGLDAGNVADALRLTGAPLVDISSGVEDAPGVKSPEKIAAFLAAVHQS